MLLLPEAGLCVRGHLLYSALCRGRLDPAFMLPGKATPLSLQSAAQAAQRDIIPGFLPAGEPLAPQAFPAPRIPKSYEPRHEFADDLAPPGGALLLLNLLMAYEMMKSMLKRGKCLSWDFLRPWCLRCLADAAAQA